MDQVTNQGQITMMLATVERSLLYRFSLFSPLRTLLTPFPVACVTIVYVLVAVGCETIDFVSVCLTFGCSVLLQARLLLQAHVAAAGSLSG
jgi:hypothetical protein